jgi:LDH2 family malate/lactate/ureidoglycolate dehydrogenase
MWQAIDAVVADVRGAEPLVVGESVRCPGDGTVATRQENQIHGAPVDAGLWAAVKDM